MLRKILKLYELISLQKSYTEATNELFSSMGLPEVSVENPNWRMILLINISQIRQALSSQSERIQGYEQVLKGIVLTNNSGVTEECSTQTKPESSSPSHEIHQLHLAKSQEKSELPSEQSNEL